MSILKKLSKVKLIDPWIQEVEAGIESLKTIKAISIESDPFDDALSQKKGGYNCEDVQRVSNTLAKHVGDFVLSAGVAKFDGFTKKFKFNRNKKDDKKPKKYGSKKFFKEVNNQRGQTRLILASK